MKKFTMVLAFLAVPIILLPSISAEEVRITFINETGAYNISFDFNVSTYDPCRRAKETKEYAGISCELEPVCPYDNPQYGYLRVCCRHDINMTYDQIMPVLRVDALDWYSEQLDMYKQNINIMNVNILKSVYVAVGGIALTVLLWYLKYKRQIMIKLR